MRYTHNYLYILACSIGFLSCTKEGISMNGSKEDVSNKVNMSLAIPSTSKAPTQSSLTRDERIDYFNIYVFESITGEEADYNLKDIVSTRSVKYDPTKGEFSTTISLERSPSPTKLIMVANQPGDISDELMPVEGKVNLISPEDSENLLIGTENNPIPSTAVIELLEGVDEDKDIDKVKLLRTMTRIDVEKNAALTDDVFQLVGISVWFSPNRGLMMSEHLQSNDAVDRVTLPEEYSALPLDYMNEAVATSPIRWECDAESGNKSTASINNKIYIYENEDFETFPDGLDSRSSRIVLWGYYNNNSYLSYYPLDFTTSDNVTPKAVMRNHNFRISIKNVLSEGFTTERDAAFGASMGVDAEIIEWVRQDQEIVFDGMNWFSLETKEVNVGGQYGDVIPVNCASSIDPKKWLMGWSDTEEEPTSYSLEEKVIYHDSDDDIMETTKPLVSEQNGEYRGVQLIYTETKNIKTKYLFLKPHDRLLIRVKVNIFPNGYIIPDWDNEGDYNGGETTIG